MQPKQKPSTEDQLAELVKWADFMCGSDEQGTTGFRFRQTAKQALAAYKKSKKRRDR